MESSASCSPTRAPKLFRKARLEGVNICGRKAERRVVVDGLGASVATASGKGRPQVVEHRDGTGVEGGHRFAVFAQVVGEQRLGGCCDCKGIAGAVH